MLSRRMLSVAGQLRAAARVGAARRGYAEAPAKGSSDSLVLNFALPHQVLYKSQQVDYVSLTTLSGDLAIYPEHVPIIAQLKPGVVEVGDKDGVKKFFVSGGFVNFTPDSVLNLTAAEGTSVENIDVTAVKSALDEAHRAINSANEFDRTVLEINVEVHEAMLAAAQDK